MFCMKCGKQIDDDSTFCPYCGNKVGDNTTVSPVNSGVGTNVPLMNDEKNIFAPTSKRVNKKLVISVVAGLAAILVIFGVVKSLSGLGKTLPERLLTMSWEEISEISDKDFKDMLDEENTLYISSSDKDIKDRWYFKTKTTVPFMNADCLFLHGSTDLDNDSGFEPYLSAQYSVLDLAWKTNDDFNKDRKELEDSLKRQMIKGSKVFKDDGGYGTTYLYAVEVSDKYVDKFAEYLNEYKKENADLSDCSIYKFVQIFYGEDVQFIDLYEFPSGKSYIDYMCEVIIFYTPMTQNEFISFASRYDYDAISGKEINYDEFIKTLDADLVSKIDPSTKPVGIYFVETYGKLPNGIEVNTDELKRIWYIKYYNWDNETKEPIDLSDYNGSKELYCAVNFNYNLEENSYFESDEDKLKLFIDNNYNPETGKSFESDTEARLWAMKNLSYDTKFDEQVDPSLFDALEAYQEYIENWIIKQGDDDSKYGALIYLDSDDIPELILKNRNTVYVLNYSSSGLSELAFKCDFVYTYYVPKSGKFYGCDLNSEEDEILYEYYLNNGKTDLVEEYHWSIVYDNNWNRTIENRSSNLGEYDTGWDYLESIQGLMSVLDLATLQTNIFDLYDTSKNVTYYTCIPKILEFSLSDGVLTVTTDNGLRYGWHDGIPTSNFSISYPVADNCIWEGEASSFEILKQKIDSEQEVYEKALKEYGYADIENTLDIFIEVVNGTVVRVDSYFQHN